MLEEVLKLIEDYKNGNTRPLWFDAFAADEKKGWVFANDFNALFEIDLDTFESKYLGSIPGEKALTGSLYWSMVKTGNRLVLVPVSSHWIVIYDIDAHKFTTIDKGQNNYSYYGAAVSGNKVYMVGNNAPVVAVFDLNDYSIKYLDNIETHKKSRKRLNDIMYFRKGICAVGKYIYCVSCDDNEVYRINTLNDITDFYEIDGITNGLRNIAFDGEYFWITEFDKAGLIKWSDESNFIERYEYSGYKDVKFRSSDIVCLDEIWVFPTSGDITDDVIIFDKTECKWHIAESLKQFCSGASERKSIWKQIIPVAISCCGNIFCFSANTNELIRIDESKNIFFKPLNVKMSDENHEKAVLDLPVIYESEGDLIKYLKYIELK